MKRKIRRVQTGPDGERTYGRRGAIRIARRPGSYPTRIEEPRDIHGWHDSCSIVGRLHSGGGPNVNSRIWG
jgi:hypothetical protein